MFVALLKIFLAMKTSQVSFDVKNKTDKAGDAVLVNDKVEIVNFSLDIAEASNQSDRWRTLFSYPVFCLSGAAMQSKVIIVLVGLTEKSTDTYSNIAFNLAERTKQPVILFPLATDTSGYIQVLIEQIENGDHPLFEKGTQIEILANSLGAELPKVMALVYPERKVTNTNLHILGAGLGSNDILVVTEEFTQLANMSRRNTYAMINADA
jgi:hypothetical protein